MTPQLTSLTHYLEDRGRRYRFTPVTELPSAEKFSQIERLVDKLWDVSAALGFNLGQKPTIIHTGENLMVPTEVLKTLTYLDAEVLSTFLMTGLGEVYATALRHAAESKPSKPTPDFRNIIEAEYY